MLRFALIEAGVANFQAEMMNGSGYTAADLTVILPQNLSCGNSGRWVLLLPSERDGNKNVAEEIQKVVASIIEKLNFQPQGWLLPKAGRGLRVYCLSVNCRSQS